MGNKTLDYKQFQENMIRYFEADAALDATKLTDDELIKKLIEIADLKNSICVANNEIIDYYITSCEKDFSLLTEERADELFDMNERNFYNGSFYDRGTSFRICKLLYKYYVNSECYEKTMYYLFLCTYFDLINQEHSVIYGKPTFAKHLDEWSNKMDLFNDKAKTKFLRYAFALVYDSSDYKNSYKRFERACELLNQSGLDRLNNREVKNSYASGLADVLSQCAEHFLNGKEPYTEEELTHIKAIYETLKEENQKGNIPTWPAIIENNIYQFDYILGNISLNELLNNFRKIMDKYQNESGPNRDISLFFSASNYLEYYWRFSENTEEEKLAHCKILLEKVLNVYASLKKEVDSFYLTSVAAQLVTVAAKFFGFDLLRNYVLEMTVRADKALYIHTIMVAEISAIIASKMLEVSPEYFDKVAGMDTDYISGHAVEFLSLVSECALFHDIGKHGCIDYISNASRHLTDDEFEIIKRHPTGFSHFFPPKDTDSAKIKCINDCATLHHVWHNGQGGYPKASITSNMPLVDVLSIADSIDAATDVIGRPYTRGKSLASLLNEFDTFRDTRYSAKVIDILKYPDVYAEIEKLITDGRREINCAVWKPSGRNILESKY